MQMTRTLFLSNTLTRKKEAFVPLDPSLVKIYSCGPTVYRDVHVGNMRAFHYADILNKVIRHILGYPTKHVMNLTDVGHLKGDGDDGEDKMEIGAKRDNLTARELADRYIDVFFDAKDKMKLTGFDHFPRATDYIQEQIDMIQTLEKKGYTYEIAGDGIYMDTDKVENYGELCQLDKQEQQAGARIDDCGKKKHTDFVLWKYSTPEEKRHMERESPWGVGYPGWHIECSAMSVKLLGNRFDIHTGGVDHIGVHHPNEIAQTECCTGHKWVNYRLHNEMLNLGGKKMAKSAGGLITVRSLEAKGYDPLDLKYLFTTGHYKNFLEFGMERLDETKKTRKKINTMLQPYLHLLDSVTDITLDQLASSLDDDARDVLDRIVAGLLDDLNTPKALAAIHTALKTLTDDIARVILWTDHHILMLGLTDHLAQTHTDDIPGHIIDLAQQRMDAKATKDRTKADTLRDEIQQAGYIIKDNADGYEIVKA